MIWYLRILGNLEGVSYLILLFIAMPLKYAYDMPMAVKITGMAHGLLFVAYCLLLAICMKRFSWKLGFGIYLFIATLIPFGTFVTDRKLKLLPETKGLLSWKSDKPKEEFRCTFSTREGEEDDFCNLEEGAED